MSVQELAVVDVTVRTFLFLEHIDHWLLNKPSIINKQKRKLFDIAVQRNVYAAQLLKCLQTLGSEKRGPQGVNLDDYVAGKYGEGKKSG